MIAPETRNRGEGRATVSIRDGLERRLLAYAAAASASVVAAQPVAAKVIYTPMNLTIEAGPCRWT